MQAKSSSHDQYFALIVESGKEIFGIEDESLTYEIVPAYDMLRSALFKRLSRIKLTPELAQQTHDDLEKFKREMSAEDFPEFPTDIFEEREVLDSTIFVEKDWVDAYFSEIDSVVMSYMRDKRTNVAATYILAELDTLKRHDEKPVVALRYGANHVPLLKKLLEEAGTSYICIEWKEPSE